MIDTLVILGGDGDLTGRLLLPALAHLAADGGAIPNIRAVGRQDFDDDAYQAWAGEQLGEHAAASTEKSWDALIDGTSYRVGDVTDPAALRTALDGVDGPVVVYLALPNTIFAATLRALAEISVPEGSVVAVEKPFGVDRSDAAELNKILHRIVPETSTFRIDHFIAKRTVLNVLGLRFGNRLFEPVWNHHHVEAVEIVYDEELGLEGRAGYYDTAGALRDMLQNHLLQLLALVAMEPPQSFDALTLPARKADALRSVRTVDPVDSIRARYTAGTVGDRTLGDYAEQDGVDPERTTETYAELRLYIDNWRWTGVPFVLRTGKALGAVRKEICVRFKPVPHSPFEGPHPDPNELRLTLDTDGIALDLDLNGEGDPFDLERHTFTVEPHESTVPAYATVLRTMLAGDSSLSISDIEAEQSWRIVEDVLAAWDNNEIALQEYEAGSDGPDDRFL
ncbi:glucose-6-phosphate dehydrogenase [Rhodococcus sp. 14-2470-1a]|uniref:glucose-6-phosphate dehydrogenase n=1 Tax=Rhodococcus sp. 14-2470-1a TaxID=2023150 RepID=UPI000B9A7229|nr:glucose-6-phosphate dehydrogenase [Rhodococcus sp. 14-2470-1a]OZF41996.1 glucose-6-phosphate dehydrogenase [Rhodococcus sp. 14-2470-1a]